MQVRVEKKNARFSNYYCTSYLIELDLQDVSTGAKFNINSKEEGQMKYPYVLSTRPTRINPANTFIALEDV